jgi:hypothetical protein
MSDIDGLEVAQDTPRLSKIKKNKSTKKDEEIQDVDIRSIRNPSITPDKGGNGEDL